MSRAYTEKEVREKFVDAVCGIVDYWLKESRAKTVEEKMSGAAFSILVLIDGGNVSLPAFSLCPSPHPSDKEYYISGGENWYEENMDISGGLHDLYCSRKRRWSWGKS